MQPIILAIQNAVSPREIGVATSSVTFFRQMGGTLGTAVFLSVLFTTLPGKIAGALDSVRNTASFQAALAAHPDQAATLQAAGQGNTDLNDTSFISRLAPVIAHPFKVGFSDSMSVVFLMGAAIMAIGLIIVFFLPEIPLADRSASQARAAEAQAEAGAAVEAAAVTASVTATAIADAHPARTEPPTPTDPYGPAALDPDADGRDGEGRSPVDGPPGDGRHEANGHEDEFRVPAPGANGAGAPIGPEANGGPVEPDPTAEPAHGRRSAGN